MSQQRKFFPGWLVVASGFVIVARVGLAHRYRYLGGACWHELCG